MRTIFFLLLLLSSALAQPKGEYIVGDHNGEDFEFLLRFEPKNVVLETLNKKSLQGTSEFKEIQPDVYHFKMPDPEEAKPVDLIRASDQEIVLTSPEEQTVLRGYRVRELPSWLDGKWRLKVGNEGMEFQGDKVLLRGDSKVKSVRAFGLAPQGPVSRVVLVEKSEMPNSVLLHFTKIEDTLLVWDQDDGKLKRFVRAD